MIEVIGDEEGSLIFYCYNMLFVFFQSHLRIFFSYPLHCWQKGYQNIFKLINFFLCFCWCMIWKIIIKKNFWVASIPHWWVLSLYMLVYSYLPSVLKALTSLLIDSLVTWLSDQMASKPSNWIDYLSYDYRLTDRWADYLPDCFPDSPPGQWAWFLLTRLHYGCNKLQCRHVNI